MISSKPNDPNLPEPDNTDTYQPAGIKFSKYCVLALCSVPPSDKSVKSKKK
jgi:hypothetical protein